MTLQDKIKNFPNRPGVYRMKDKQGTILYIGKAKDLRKRVQSYFTKAAQDRYQIAFLLKRVDDIDCIVTDTEKEALILENTLIKKHRPKYNLDLRDDKSYPSIKLSIRDRYPRIYYTREIKKDKNLYFGPYSSALACRQVVDFIERYFQLRTCSDSELKNRRRPCIQYQIGRCLAPCVDYISEEDYDAIVRRVRLLLEGKSRELTEEMRALMQEASRQLRFEEAAHYRDLIKDLDQTLEQQKMFSHRGEDRDVIGLYREGEAGMVAVMMIRDGKVVETRWFPFNKLAENEDVLESFLVQFYSADHYVPREICVPLELPSATLIEEYIREVRAFKTSVVHPQKGPRADLVFLATENARQSFERRQQKQVDVEALLEYLQRRLHLVRLPRRIECFDISNIQGKEAVGSLACFQDGHPDKSGYRRFKIKTMPEEPNDYAMMYEVLSRRFKRREGEKWQLPDLIVIDGGKGQLNIAKKVMENLDILSVDLCAIAKGNKEKVSYYKEAAGRVKEAKPTSEQSEREGEAPSGFASGGGDASPHNDKIFIPGRANPIVLPKNSSALHLLMRLRDEAHRFAITYHKALRDKKMQASELDDIPGIGTAKKKELLKHFGSLKRVKLASVEDLCEVKGITKVLAERIHTHLGH